MEEQKKSLSYYALYYGVLTGLGLIVFSLLAYLLDASTDKTFQYLASVILIAGLIFAQRNYRKADGNEFSSYGTLLGLGTFTAFIAAILSAIYVFVFFTYIDPEAMKPIIEEAEKNLYQQGLSGEQFDAALGMTRKFMKPGMMAVSSLFTYTLWGFIISLITSIFIQKKPN